MIGQRVTKDNTIHPEDNVIIEYIKSLGNKFNSFGNISNYTKRKKKNPAGCASKKFVRKNLWDY